MALSSAYSSADLSGYGCGSATEPKDGSVKRKRRSCRSRDEPFEAAVVGVLADRVGPGTSLLRGEEHHPGRPKAGGLLLF